MALLKPRIGNVRVFVGADQRESTSAGEFIAGFTTYLDPGCGQEEYSVNYITFGGRSDAIQNVLSVSQGDAPTTRRVGSSETDEKYVGTIEENAGHAICPDGEPVVLEVATSAAA